MLALRRWVVGEINAIDGSRCRVTFMIHRHQQVSNDHTEETNAIAERKITLLPQIHYCFT